VNRGGAVARRIPVPLNTPDLIVVSEGLAIAGFRYRSSELKIEPWRRRRTFLRGAVVFKGGITLASKRHTKSEAFSMNYEIHHGSNSLDNVASLHFAIAIRNCEYFEVLLSDEANRFGLIEDIVVDAQGRADGRGPRYGDRSRADQT